LEEPRKWCRRRADSDVLSFLLQDRKDGASCITSGVSTALAGCRKLPSPLLPPAAWRGSMQLLLMLILLLLLLRLV
jgi:hypothetical protein